MSDKTLKELTVDAHIAVLHTKVDALIEKQKEITERVRSNEKVVAALGVLGSIAIAFIGAGAFAPRAEACSPPLDGSPFTCPPPDGIVVCMGMEICPKLPDIGIPTPVSRETVKPDYYKEHSGYYQVTLVDTRGEGDKWNYGSLIHRVREWKNEQERTPISDMINSSLAEYENGSDGSTESEELLQLPSNGDS